jgi:Dienelactone hydrolase family
MIRQVIEEEIEIRTADGTSDGLLFRQEGEQGRPGVIHLTDIGGIRPAQREMARRLAAEGHIVLMPNIFYRTARPPVMDFKPGGNNPLMMKRFCRADGTPDARSHRTRRLRSNRFRCSRRGLIRSPRLLRSTGEGWSPMSLAARTSCCRASRPDFTSDIRSTTAACRKKPSKSSTARSQPGAANTKASLRGCLPQLDGVGQSDL